MCAQIVPARPSPCRLRPANREIRRRAPRPPSELDQDAAQPGVSARKPRRRLVDHRRPRGATPGCIRSSAPATLRARLCGTSPSARTWPCSGVLSQRRALSPRWAAPPLPEPLRACGHPRALVGRPSIGPGCLQADPGSFDADAAIAQRLAALNARDPSGGLSAYSSTFSGRDSEATVITTTTPGSGCADPAAAHASGHGPAGRASQLFALAVAGRDRAGGAAAPAASSGRAGPGNGIRNHDRNTFSMPGTPSWGCISPADWHAPRR